MIRIAYICYWGVNDVLTVSSALPTINSLANRNDVYEIDFYTFERDNSNLLISYQLPIKVNLIQIYEGSFSIVSKFFAYRSLVNKMVNKHKNSPYDLTIGRSVFGGIASYLFNKKTKVKYVVESFEPHANYMIDTGVWREKSLKVKVLNYYHNKIIQSENKLVTVSKNYKDFLVSSGINKKRVFVIPCTVDLDIFKRNAIDRQFIRAQMRLKENDILSVYVGKFGGLYYDNEAFVLFKKSFEQIKNSYLLILSNQNENWIKELAMKNHFPLDKLIIKEVSHSDVPKYLSASDLAFATIKQFPSSKFSSAIKIGEYWANGLPIIITDGVGDDSDIVKSEQIGVVVNIADSLNFSDIINTYVNSTEQNKKIRNVAIKYRHRNLINKVYSEIFDEF